MSCLYCGGENCGSSAGGPSMCENSATHNEIIYNPRDMSIPELEARLKETKEILDKKIKKRDAISDKPTEGNK